MNPVVARGLALLIVVAAIFGTGFLFGWSWVGQDFAEYREAQEKALNKAQQEVRTKEAQHRRAVAELDEQHTQELNDAQAEIDRLSDAVAAGRRRLSVRAECVSDTGETESAAGVGNGQSARLTDAAERNYFRLRSRIETITGQLTACQDYIRSLPE